MHWCSNIQRNSAVMFGHSNTLLHIATSQQKNGTCDITMDKPPALCDITMGIPPYNCDVTMAFNKQMISDDDNEEGLYKEKHLEYKNVHCPWTFQFIINSIQMWTKQYAYKEGPPLLYITCSARPFKALNKLEKPGTEKLMICNHFNKRWNVTSKEQGLQEELGVCIEDGYPYRVLGSFCDLMLVSWALSSNPPSRLMPKFDLHTCIYWNLIWYIKTPRLFPNPSLTRTVSLCHTCHNNSMICPLIRTKTSFYWANADENGFLHIFSTENILNSHALS